MFVLVVLLSLSAVSAADIDAAIDNEIDVSDISNSEPIETNPNDDISLEADGTFTDLSSQIESASPNETITLDKDYYWDGSGNYIGIELNKTITIDGQGHTIDAESADGGYVRIFNIYGTDIVLKNIVFANADRNYNQVGGGAIYVFEGATVSIINCTFVNNTAAFGAAINSYGGVNVTDCTFYNNSVTYNGGAIVGSAQTPGFTGAYLHVTNSKFYNNSAGYGGAILGGYESNVTIADSEFINNSARYNGGALDFTTYVTPVYVSNSIFKNNSANNGGAIYLATAEPIVIVDDCVFENNNAINNGGVVFANDDSPYTSIYDITFNNCDINGNSAKNGAVVYAEDNLVGTNVTIVSSNVINNTADSFAIGYMGEGSKIAIINSNVSDNEAKDNTEIDGTSVINFSQLEEFINQINGSLTLNSDVVMTEEEAGKYVSGITIDKDLIINGNGFKIDANNLGAIFNVTNRATLTLNNVTLTNAVAKNGAVVYATRGNVNIYNSVITSNEATNFRYGIIAAISSSNINIINTTFSDNKNLIYQVGGTLNIDSSKFTNNEGVSSISDLIFLGATDTTITNSEFIGNDGTMVFNNNGGSVIISDSIFKDHTGSEAVYNNADGHMEIVSSEFINCDEGAAFNNGNGYMLVNGSNFVNNSGAGGSAGAIFSNSNSQLDIYDSSFINNSAISSGGAIFINGASDIYIENSEFTDNSALSSGDAIYVNGANANLTIADSIFTNNDVESRGDVNFIVSDFSHLENAINAVDDELVLDSDVTMTDAEADKYKDGITINKDITINAKGHTIDANELGRIFNIANSATLTLNNAVLINGRADKGGAIYNDGTLNINNVTFKDNAADNWGGAIYDNGVVTVVDSTFNGNDIINRGSSSTDYGGAAIFSNGDLKVDNSIFTNNIKNYENGDCLTGAITSYGDVTVTNSYFANNSGRWGAAFSSADYNDKDLVTIIDNCTFIDNKGLYGAGIWSWGTDFSITDSIFTDNTAFGKGNMTPNNNNGGAIAVYGATSTGVISGSTFIGNDAHYGGAIAIAENDGILIKDSTFINNTAIAGGGAVEFDAALAGTNNVTIENSTFIGNSAAQGGAITTSEKLTVTGSTFINNTDNYEGAIVTIVDATVSDSEFVNNGIITNGKLTVSGNTFTSDSKDYFIQSAGAGVVVSEFGFEITVEEDVISADESAKFYVNLTDDNGNVIWEADGIKVTIDGKVVTAVFNPDTNLYEVEYVTDASGIFTATAEYNGVSDDVAIAFYKANTEIAVVGNTSYEYGEDFDFIITVDPAVNGTVTVIVSDENFDVEKNYTFTVVDGIVDYDFADFIFTPGVYTITVIYPGDSLNEFATTIFTINVEMLYSDVTVDVTEDAVYGDDVTITVTTDKDAEGAVGVTVDGETYEVQLVNGTGSLIVSGLNAGKYDVFVEYYGDMIYAPATAIATVTVNKADSTVNVSVEDSVYGEDVILNITSSAPGYVAVFIDEKYTIYYVDGEISIELPYIAVGEHDVSVVFIGDVNYESSQANTSFAVDKAVSDVTVNIPVVGDDYVIISTIFENDATGEVTISINGESVTAELVNGLQVIYVPGLDAGDYVVEIVYHGDENYKELTTNATFTINETLVLSAEDTTLYYKNGTSFDVSVTDGGNAVVGVDVIFTIDGVDYVRTTDDEGVASITINLRPGVYEITASYGNQSITRNVTVLSTIVSEDLTKYYRNESQFDVVILDGNGNPVSGVKIEYNIDGLFYYRTTDDDGFARFDINLRPGEYIITVKNMANGEVTSNKVTVLSTIVIEDLTKYYCNESQFYMTVVDGQGKPLANQEVSINIDGVFYYRTTDSNGVARLDINLRPGEYILTVQDSTGLMRSALVTVLPTLTGEDVVMDFMDGSTYDVAVVDGQGKPLVNETVTMNINGVFYNKVTDENGIASLDINLRPGEYIITTTHENATISNKITVKQA
ncbi:beta strand repeat-containing protein [Methanobrevibacter woesei]|uniref:beta strand repeat-containing protein n=1 Tax=Methanobrevibacter woesei TaxID=190976 RepID=UPI002356ED3B|nr:Ig-like domain repeat protein [Methanobrevibacter woesei]